MQKVSVIIPVYNTEEYLDKSFESLLNQTYTNLELIVINDGSNEATSNKLKQFAEEDNRIQLYELPERKGVGHARNYGLTKATGKYIYYFDSDDYLSSNTLDLLVTYIKNDPVISGGIRTTNFVNSYAVIFQGIQNKKQMVENRFNLIKRDASVNFLFRRDYLIDNGFRHQEDLGIYSDLSFIVPIIAETPIIYHVPQALYFRRRRNDPIKNPSLSQVNPIIKAKDYLRMCVNLIEMNLNDEAKDFIEKQLINYYRKDIVKLFEDEQNIDALFEDLTKALQKIDYENLQKYDWFLKRELNPIVNENKKTFKRRNSRHQLLREVKRVMTAKNKKRRLYRLLYSRVFLKMPIKEDLVFFESFLAKSYSDSPKAVYEELIRTNKEYKTVWSFRETGKDIPGKSAQVKRFSLRYFYYLARAKYWVSNSRMPRYLKKPEGNIYLQTWHGTPLKTLVFDIDEIYSADPNYKANFHEQSRRWDYLTSPNEYSTKIFRRAFDYDKPMLEYGYPRNDVLYNKNNEENINQIKQKLNLPMDKKLVLYAPTWRDDEFFSRGNYKFTLKLDLEKLQNELGDEYIVLLRTHYHIANELDVSEYEGFVYDFSLYDDIAELYLVSDVLITDYSSVFFDYANLKRPMLFFTYDIEKYRDELRGMYLDMEKDLPGPLLMTTKEVIHALKNIKEVSNEYAQKYDEFYDRFCKWEDGNASEKTVEIVFNNK